MITHIFTFIIIHVKHFVIFGNPHPVDHMYPSYQNEIYRYQPKQQSMYQQHHGQYQHGQYQQQQQQQQLWWNHQGTDPCDRQCIAGSSLTCHYNFTVEWQQVLGKSCFKCPSNMADCIREQCVSADGVERGILTANRILPGPGIVVCEGDRVVVKVENRLPATTTSIHWHGQHQKGAPWSDGVPMVTQCPILPETTFMYSFIAGTAGTHWWHSHVPLQREDGLYGKFIVRQPDIDNVHKGMYDEDRSDHVIIIQDWAHTIGVDRFLPHHYDDGPNKPQSYLINGKGRFRNFGIDIAYPLYTPIEEFNVVPGRKYRFRVINAGVQMCPVEMTVEDHKMTVIATDGMDVRPVTVDVLIIHDGERYDVIIDTNNKEVKTYRMKFGGHIDCAVNKVHGMALLKYKSNQHKEDTLELKTKYEDFVNNPGKQLNAICQGQGDPQKMSVADLRSARKSDRLPRKADRTLYFHYEFRDLTNPNFYHHPLYTFQDVKYKFKFRTPQINNISNTFPSSPLLSQPHNIDKEKMCNNETLDKHKHCDEQGFCECHHIIELNLNEVVDIFLIDEGVPFTVTHPFHLHGHSFHVLAMDRLVHNQDCYGPPQMVHGSNKILEKVKEMERNGKIPRNLYNPPLKDTVVVPAAGYTLIRLKADNPGYWMFHCHMSWHNEVGMSLIWKVGNDFQIPKPPKGFPMCGDFLMNS